MNCFIASTSFETIYTLISKILEFSITISQYTASIPGTSKSFLSTYFMFGFIISATSPPSLSFFSDFIHFQDWRNLNFWTLGCHISERHHTQSSSICNVFFILMWGVQWSNGLWPINTIFILFYSSLEIWPLPSQLKHSMVCWLGLFRSSTSTKIESIENFLFFKRLLNWAVVDNFYNWWV